MDYFASDTLPDDVISVIVKYCAYIPKLLFIFPLCAKSLSKKFVFSNLDEWDLVAIQNYLVTKMWEKKAQTESSRGQILSEMSIVCEIMRNSSVRVKRIRVGQTKLFYDPVLHLTLDTARCKLSTLQHLRLQNTPNDVFEPFVAAIEPKHLQTLFVELYLRDDKALTELFSQSGVSFPLLRKLVIYAPTRQNMWAIRSSFPETFMGSVAAVTSCLEYVSFEGQTFTSCLVGDSEVELERIRGLFRRNSSTLKFANFGTPWNSEADNGITRQFVKFVMPSKTTGIASVEEIIQSCRERLHVDISCLSIHHLSLWCIACKLMTPEESQSLFDLCHPEAASADWAFLRAIRSLAFVLIRRYQSKQDLLDLFDRLLTQANKKNLLIARDVAENSQLCSHFVSLLQLPSPGLRNQPRILHEIVRFICRQPYIFRTLKEPSDESGIQETLEFLEKAFSDINLLKVASDGRFSSMKGFLRDAFDDTPIAFNWYFRSPILKWALSHFDVSLDQEFFALDADGTPFISGRLQSFLSKFEPDHSVLLWTLDAIYIQPTYSEQLKTAFNGSTHWQDIFEVESVRRKLAKACTHLPWRCFLDSWILRRVTRDFNNLGLFKVFIEEHHDWVISRGLAVEEEPSVEKKHRLIDAEIEKLQAEDAQ